MSVWNDLRPVRGDEGGLFNGGRRGVGRSEGLIKRQRAADVGISRFGGVHFIAQEIQFGVVVLKQVTRFGAPLVQSLAAFTRARTDLTNFFEDLLIINRHVRPYLNRTFVQDCTGKQDKIQDADGNFLKQSASFFHEQNTTQGVLYENQINPIRHYYGAGPGP